MSVDEFQGALTGLFIIEVEFKTEEKLLAFAAPDFAIREVTDDVRYTGAHLALHGMPSASC